MQLRVFVDGDGEYHLEISSPALIYKRRLFVPMLRLSAPILQGLDRNTLVEVSYAEEQFSVPYLLVLSEDPTLKRWRHVGVIHDNDSRNVLNHILDVMAWD